MGRDQNEVTPVPVPSRDSRLPERKQTAMQAITELETGPLFIKKLILIFLLLTLLTMENILLDIKDLIYGRNWIIN